MQVEVWLQVMLKCAPQLREDQQEWAIVVHSILDSSVAANRWLLHFLSHQAQEEDATVGEEVIENFLLWCDQVRHLASQGRKVVTIQYLQAFKE